MPVESYHALAQVREKVSAAISVGERLHTRFEFVPVLEQELADYIMPDVTWTGGISEIEEDRHHGGGLLRAGLAA